MRRTLGFLFRYLTAVVFVGASSVLADIFYRITGSDRLTAIFLAGVLLTAFVVGSGPAYLASILAFGVYMFLVDPRYRWSFGSPEDLNALAVFLVVAFLVGNLMGRARNEAQRERSRRRSANVLLAATTDFSVTGDAEFMRQRLAEHAATAARGAAVVRSGDRVTVSPGAAVDDDVVRAAGELEQQALDRWRMTERVGCWSLRALIADGVVWGVLGWTTQDGRSLAQDEVTALEILVDAGAAAMARVHLASAKAEAESRARTEDLRNALLSSISHDLRTPLAAILASATSLQEFGDSFDEATRRDLATTIQEEVLRMDDAVANLLNMSRLEAGGLQIRAVSFNLPEILHRSVKRRARNAHERIQLSIVSDLPEARGDPVLFEQAFGNVLENAIRHGGRDGAIVICARRNAGLVEIMVADHGPGVAPSDLEAIFSKFYRAENSARTPGTGLGLSIARGLLHAMGGSIAAENRDGGGLIVTLAVPAAADALTL